MDWLGLARWARTEDEALDALVRYAPRFQESVAPVARSLKLPRSAEDLDVVQRVGGNATTDFGAPAGIIESDRRALSKNDLDAAVSQLRAAWAAFDEATRRVHGKALGPSGPRGGGRSLEKMANHVREADEGYTAAMGGKSKPAGAKWSIVQENFIAAARARNAGELPDVGPRGGERWPALFAMRRSAWHALDHAWELEDRSS
nr:Unknown Function [uncultured bacterium]